MFPELVLRDVTARPNPQENPMKSLCAAAALTTAVVLAGGLQPASAQREGPWCAHIGIGDDSYVERCDMLSYEMCRTEIFAQGGAYCTQNPRYRGIGGNQKAAQGQTRQPVGGMLMKMTDCSGVGGHGHAGRKATRSDDLPRAVVRDRHDRRRIGRGALRHALVRDVPTRNPRPGRQPLHPESALYAGAEPKRSKRQRLQ